MHFRFVRICTSVLSFLSEIAIKFITKNFLSLELFYFCTMYRTSIYKVQPKVSIYCILLVPCPSLYSFGGVPLLPVASTRHKNIEAMNNFATSAGNYIKD